MSRHPLKDRIVLKNAEKRRFNIDEPFIQKERPSLKGRIHQLPKSAIWRRMSGWPLNQTEEGPAL